MLCKLHFYEAQSLYVVRSIYSSSSVGTVLSSAALAPGLGTLVRRSATFHYSEATAQRLTFWFFVRWFLILRANHSLLVWLLSKILVSCAPLTASATIALSSARACRTTLSPGRVNIARDQRGKAAWAPGAGLFMSSEVTGARGIRK